MTQLRAEFTISFGFTSLWNIICCGSVHVKLVQIRKFVELCIHDYAVCMQGKTCILLCVVRSFVRCRSFVVVVVRSLSFVRCRCRSFVVVRRQVQNFQPTLWLVAVAPSNPMCCDSSLLFRSARFVVVCCCCYSFLCSVVAVVRYRYVVGVVVRVSSRQGPNLTGLFCGVIY